MLQETNPSARPPHRLPSLRLDYREGSLRRLAKAERLSSGALRLRANMTRTGVLEYDTGNEYRPASEVFAPESLASLRSAPVVIGHPPSGEVTLDTWKGLAVGHVESVHRDGPFVSGTIVIHDPHTIELLEGGHLNELSPGYTSRVEERAGTAPDGKRFDGVQKVIRYNHLALLPAGMGRSGSDVRIRTDARLSARAVAAGWTAEDLSTLQTVAALASSIPNVRTDQQSAFTPEEIQALLRIARLPRVQAMALETTRRERDDAEKRHHEAEDIELASRHNDSDDDEDDSAWLIRKIQAK